MNRCISAAILLLVAAACPAGEIWVDQASAASATPDGAAASPFKQIAPALKQARPGDTVIVKAGLYRESVVVPSGEPNRPVTLQAAPGERVILSGAVLVPQWQPAGNGLYTATVNFRPSRMFVAGRLQPVARQPNDGWWVSSAAKDTTLTGPADLKTLAVDPTGGEVYVWTRNGNTFFTVPIASLDRAAGRLEVTRTSKWMNLADRDKYYLRNHPSLIDRPGEWAVQPEGKAFRITWRPARPEDLSLAELPKEPRQIVGVSRARHVRIEGLEVVASEQDGISLGGSEDVVVAGCAAYFNGRLGIQVRDVRNVTIRRNISWRNEYGISLHTVTGAVVEENDVGYNGTDGLTVTWNTKDVTVRRNYLHHHLLWGHPDNMQVYRTVTHVRFLDNLLLAGGQSLMMEETSDGVIAGNMFVGCCAYSLILGHANTDGYKIRGNTIALVGYGCISFTGKDYDLRENVLMAGHPGPLYGMRTDQNFTADRNLYCTVAGLAGDKLLVSDTKWHASLAGFQKATGQDANSVCGDPRFRSAPKAVGILDTARLTDCTGDTWHLRRGAGPFAVGDTVEVDFDGVPRKLTAVEGDKLTAAPPRSQRPTKEWIICNWGQAKTLDLDLRLQADSPGAKLAADGGPVGSKLDVGAYRRGDFNGDGRRDLPPMPAELLINPTATD